MPLLPVYNERTDFDLEVTLLDKDGDPLVPTETHYHIHDVESATTIKNWTALTIDGTGQGTIEVLAADQDIIDDANEYETRILTVSAVYGASKEFHEEYRYRLKNLVVVPRETGG
jgi:hypothetical protein